MKIEETITVQRPVEAVWALFQDVPELSRCLPGAELTEDRGGGVYAGKVAAKLGPMTATFEGEANVTMDETSRTGEVKGKGTDRAGGSVGQVSLKYTITPADGGGSTVAVDADVILSGAAAQFGRTGLIREMSRRLIAEFVQCVEAKLAAETAEQASAVQAGDVRGISLFFASLWQWIKGLFRRSPGS
jgi:carbon monoxide dehydrogenase subunit G